MLTQTTNKLSRKNLTDKLKLNSEEEGNSSLCLKAEVSLPLM
ncbi:MAG: hypothetical protein AABX17_03880 [Nanoarchaeota archaeon]